MSSAPRVRRASFASLASSAAILSFVAGCTTNAGLPCGTPSDSNGTRPRRREQRRDRPRGRRAALKLGWSRWEHGGQASSSGSGSTSGSAGGSSSGGNNGSSSGTTSSGDGGALDLPPAAARGASLPYFEYEAEDTAAATTNGTVLPVSTTEGNIASEASGRTAVRLQGVGQNVSFTLKHRANSIVVRYSRSRMRRRAEGRLATLGLCASDGRPPGQPGPDLALLLDVRRDEPARQPVDRERKPIQRAPAHHFYDETRALFPQEMPVGTVVKLQQDGKDTAASYVIDLVDFEDVAPPLAQPAGSLSIMDSAYGATPDDPGRTTARRS